MHADVLIIGAGPAGGVAARRFSEAGMSVVCLERGEWPDRADYRGGEDDFELTSMKQWSWNPNVRQGAADYAVDMTDSDVLLANFNGVGGSTTLFNALWPRLTPNNFRSHSAAGYGHDWPFGYEELLPHYERTDLEVGVSGLGGNPAYPPGADPPLPPLPIRAGGRRMAEALAELGWHWWPTPNAILSAPYDGRNVCVARAACGSGCGEGAKGSADLTHWRHVRAGGGVVVTGARVTRIVLDTAGLAVGAEYFDSEGVGHLQTADVVLCAANGIGTPRLLLASAESRYPDGLANGSGMLGKNLMLHHYGSVFGRFPEPMETWRGQRGGWISSWQFYESDAGRGAPGTSMWAFGGGPIGPLGSALLANTWGDQHHAVLAQNFGHTLSCSVCVEDVALETNFVELSPSVNDSAGLAIPVVHYSVPQQAHTLMGWHLASVSEVFRAAGADDVRIAPVPEVSGHFMGTARMGDDPKHSVVDRYGMSHEIPNLGVLDGSVFVTSGGVNPTTTICAVASRIADSLLERRSHIPRPSRPTSFSLSTTHVAPTVGAVALTPLHLTDVERERLDVLGDVLIPRVSGHPSASDVGISGSLLTGFRRGHGDGLCGGPRFCHRRCHQLCSPAKPDPCHQAVARP